MIRAGLVAPEVRTVNGKRAAEVGRLVAAARRASVESPKVRSLAELADEQWRRAAALSASPGRQRTALLHAEEYARAAFMAAGGSQLSVAVPQD
jgi:hypothetical protein